MSDASDPLSVVHHHLAAFNDADLDRLVASFADDATFASGDAVVVGRRAIRRWFADAFAQPARQQLELRRAVVHGAVAACELIDHLTIGETTHQLELAGFYTVRDAALTRVRIYRDPTSA